MTLNEAVLENPDSCPNCRAGMNDIDWGNSNHQDDMVYWSAVCDKCGCCFTQENKVVYRLTTWEN